MKYALLLALMLLSLSVPGQDEAPLFKGTWVMKSIKDQSFEPYGGYITPKIQFDDDSVLIYQFTDTTLTIYRKEGYWKDTLHFPYTYRVDTAYDKMPLREEIYTRVSKYLALSRPSNHTKKSKKRLQEMGIEPDIEKIFVQKITHSEMVLDDYFHDNQNVFLQNADRKYYFERVITDEEAITERDFKGKWFSCRYIPDIYGTLPDTLFLQRDSCNFLSEKPDKFGYHHRYTEGLYFGDGLFDRDIFTTYSYCLDCFLNDGLWAPSPWYITPEKNEIAMNMEGIYKVYRYRFAGNKLTLIKVPD